MIANFLKIAFRQARQYKEYTIINIIGLAISFAGCMLISLWILDELNYDKGYPDVERIQVILVNGETICPNEFSPWESAEDSSQYPETDTGLISMTIFFQDGGKNIYRLEIPEKSVTIQRY